MFGDINKQCVGGGGVDNDSTKTDCMSVCCHWIYMKYRK